MTEDTIFFQYIEK